MKSASLEKFYQKHRSESLNCWINSLSVIGLVATVINVLVQVYLISDKINPTLYPFPEVLNLSYAATAVNAILGLLIISISSSKTKRILYYVQYFSMGCAFFYIDFSLSFFEIDASNRYNLYGLEALIRIINIVGFFEFIDCLVMTLADIVCVIILYFIFQKGNINGFILPYVLFTLCFMIVSYCIVYTRKISFYFSEKNKKERDWFKNIIENMKSGFISVKDNKICLINEVMLEIVKRSANVRKIIKESQERGTNQMIEDSKMINMKFLDVEENSRLVLNELLKDFSNESVKEDRNERVRSEIENLVIQSNDSIQNINNFSHYNYFNIPPCDGNKVPFLELFKKNNCSNDNKFILIGTKALQMEINSEEDYLTLEIYCRYHYNIDTKKDEFEIIFNDVTKAKQVEEKKSEMKYKSIFLSKVAHEFKNPLICIMELVNQLSEKFRQIKEGESEVIMDCEDSLYQINSFSNYLMILIKDLDYFSQNEIHQKQIQTEKYDCELKEILKFCNDIGLSLLKRNGKDKNISFKIETASDVPPIIKTDESRLKQVLVNIVSNSIKFTNHGKVTLKVLKKQSNVVFCVSDTGVGIEDKNKKNLFAPYNSCTKSNSINPHGSGLGMSIIHDLTLALGKQIEFKSELNKGSEFFFSIPITTKNNIKSSSKSLNSFGHNYFEINEYSKINKSSSKSLNSNANNYFEIKEYSKTSRPSINNTKILQKCSSLNSAIIKKNPNTSIKQVKRKNSEMKSLFFENSNSKFDELNKSKHNFSNNSQDYCLNESNSIVHDSLLDIDERNIFSLRDHSKRSILFPDTKSIMNISSNNKIDSPLQKINLVNFSENEINLNEPKRTNFSLETKNKEIKKMNTRENISLNINNNDTLDKFMNKPISKSSRNHFKKNELLSEFITSI